MADDLAPVYRMLDGQSETVGALQAKVAALEAQVERQRNEMRQMLVDVLYELRDDSDFSKPWWHQGLGHVAEHLGSDRGQQVIQSHGMTKLAEWWVRVQLKVLRGALADWVLIVVLMAAGLGVVILLAQSGLLTRALGVK